VFGRPAINNLVVSLPRAVQNITNLYSDYSIQHGGFKNRYSFLNKYKIFMIEDDTERVIIFMRGGGANDCFRSFNLLIFNALSLASF